MRNFRCVLVVTCDFGIHLTIVYIRWLKSVTQRNAPLWYCHVRRKLGVYSVRSMVRWALILCARWVPRRLSNVTSLFIFYFCVCVFYHRGENCPCERMRSIQRKCNSAQETQMRRIRNRKTSMFRTVRETQVITLLNHCPVISACLPKQGV